MPMWDVEANRLVTGYGATTLPGLTEAITIEKNVTLANNEAARLTETLENITAALRA
jgi:N-acetylated-alpha-linked acidic dipeptidase